MVERLADVVVRACLEPAYLVDRLVACGEHDHRHGAERTDLAQHLVPIGVRKPDVEQDEVGSLVLDKTRWL